MVGSFEVGRSCQQAEGFVWLVMCDFWMRLPVNCEKYLKRFEPRVSFGGKGEEM
jgi:hypothetical protein